MGVVDERPRCSGPPRKAGICRSRATKRPFGAHYAREIDAPRARVVQRVRKHVQTSKITRHVWKQMRDRDERVWLFRPTAASLEVAAVNRYLKLKPERGGCRKDAYKVRVRKPWYLTRMPEHAHGFLSGMCQSGPVICFNEMSTLSATNTLYTVQFAARLTRNERLAWALMLLTSNARSQIKMSHREYALGLRKLEPGDLEGLQLPIPTGATISWTTYTKAVQAMTFGDFEQASRIADEYIRIL
jgi:hypothetical protein